MNSTRLLLLSASIAFLLGSCSKSDNNTAATGSTWIVAGKPHKVNNFTTASETYSAYDTAFEGISFTFSSFPPSDGSYTVVGNTASLGAGQVKVAVFSFATSANTYFATGSDHTSAAVSMVNGRPKIVLPDTWALKGSGTDSVKISANLGSL